MQCSNHGKLAALLKFGYFSYFKSMYNIYFAYCCILGTRILIQFCLCICVVQMPNSFKQRTRYLWLLHSVPYLLIWFDSVHLVSSNLSRHYNTKSYYWNENERLLKSHKHFFSNFLCLIVLGLVSWRCSNHCVQLVYASWPSLIWILLVAVFLLIQFKNIIPFSWKYHSSSLASCIDI